jgi:hypothetical protein
VLAEDPGLRQKRSWRGRTLSDETKAKIAAAHIGMTHTPESRQKMSKAKTGRVVHSPEHYRAMGLKMRGRPAPFPNRRFYYADCAFRSSWEMRVAKALDALGMRWQYEAKRFDLVSQTYAPDFYLPDGNCYWEVKGYYGPKSKRTIELFREHYPNETLLVINERAMKAIEAASRATD